MNLSKTPQANPSVCALDYLQHPWAQRCRFPPWHSHQLMHLMSCIGLLASTCLQCIHVWGQAQGTCMTHQYCLGCMSITMVVTTTHMYHLNLLLALVCIFANIYDNVSLSSYGNTTHPQFVWRLWCAQIASSSLLRRGRSRHVFPNVVPPHGNLQVLMSKLYQHSPVPESMCALAFINSQCPIV